MEHTADVAEHCLEPHSDISRDYEADLGVIHVAHSASRGSPTVAQIQRAHGKGSLAGQHEALLRQLVWGTRMRHRDGPSGQSRMKNMLT